MQDKLAQMACDTITGMFKATKVAEYNALSDLLSHIMHAWAQLRTPLT